MAAQIIRFPVERRMADIAKQTVRRAAGLDSAPVFAAPPVPLPVPRREAMTAAEIAAAVRADLRDDPFLRDAGVVVSVRLKRSGGVCRVEARLRLPRGHTDDRGRETKQAAELRRWAEAIRIRYRTPDQWYFGSTEWSAD